MTLCTIFGIGAKKIRAQNHKANGIVTKVKKCWWVKVNRKVVRMHPLDGAEFPRMVDFVYSVKGEEYRGYSFVKAGKKCPKVGKKIIVYYDKDKPSRYAID